MTAGLYRNVYEKEIKYAYAFSCRKTFNSMCAF